MTNTFTLVAEPGSQNMYFTREFDAPAHRVFRAHIDPQLVPRWLGPRILEMVIDHFDARTGGSYRYRHINPENKEEYGFFGSFHEVVPDKRIVQTFEFAGMPGCPAIEMMTLEELDDGGRCLLRGTSTYLSVDGRDGMVNSEMESGMAEGYERLDEIVQT